jgi:hypothetical protein
MLGQTSALYLLIVTQVWTDSVDRAPSWQDSYDRLNLSDISLESSELSTCVANDMTGIALSLLSNAVEPSPTLSPTAFHADPVDVGRSNAPWSPGDFQNRDPESSASRKSRRKRFRAPYIKTSVPEAAKQRSKVLAKNRVAANRYRLRQKEYVENLERRCRKEIEQRHIQSSLVTSLQQEISHLNEEIVMQSSLCNCMHIRGQLEIRDRLYAQLLG